MVGSTPIKVRYEDSNYPDYNYVGPVVEFGCLLQGKGVIATKGDPDFFNIFLFARSNQPEDPGSILGMHPTT